MEQRSRVIFLILSVLLVGCLSFAQAQEDGSLSVSVSGSVLESSSLEITDRNPCSFRGQFLSHGQSQTLDPCTVCTCKNGTTTCNIESCPSEAGCEPDEIVVIPQECCPQCPYKMYVENTNNLYDETFEFSEGETKRIRFGLDIEVDRKLTSRTVRGENLWKLTAWVSPNEDGSGARFSEQDNVFNEKDAAKEYLKPNYPPWDWAKLRYTMKFTGGSCADYRYFCVQFGQADEPRPTYDLSFTFQAVDNEEERLIDCVPLGTCKGLKAVDLDWTIEAEDPVFGQDTPVTLDVDVKFDPDSANKKGEGLWRVGLFGSANEDGSGPRFDEISQTLTEEEAATAKKGIVLPIEGIETNFEIGSIGCTDEASYVCVEFAQGDNPDPPFTMTIEYVRQGGAELDTMILCKPQECSARAIFSTLVPELTGDFPVIENRLNNIELNLDAITDKDLSTVVPGDSLWELGTFFNARPNGKGPRIQEKSQILNPFQQDLDLLEDANLDFNGIEFPTDLTGLVCSDIPYICFELKKNEGATLNYLFGTNPTQDPFVECIDFSKYCKGVIYQGIIWDRKIPDHRPGDPVPLTINAAIEVDPVSRGLTGDGLYGMSVFVASDPDGSDRQTPSFDQVLTPAQMSTRLPSGGPLVINGIMTPPLIAEQLGCADMKYLCVEFRKGRRANPDYTAEFTQSETEIGSADDNVVFKRNSLIQCREENCPDFFPPLEFVTRPEDVTVEEQQTVQLFCRVNDEDANYYWFKGRKQLSNEDLQEGIIVLPSRLIILHVQESDSATYTCLARNSRGQEVQDSSQLFVTSFPGKSATPVGTDLFQEGVVILPCRVDSLSPVVTCYDNGILIGEGVSHNVLTVKENVRLITDAALDHQETYKCTAPYLENAQAEASALIPFLTEDVFATEPSDSAVLVGEGHKLECSTNNPTFTVRWLKDEAPLVFNNRIFELRENLVLRNVNVRDAGVYTCIASDYRGNQVASISAKVTVLHHGLDGLECGRQTAQGARGQDTVKGSAPWMARLSTRGRHLCGGSLIDRQWVVTAAHCFHDLSPQDYEDLSIRLGGHDVMDTEQSEVLTQVEQIYVHENFDFSTFDNDIALIKLANPIRTYNDYIRPICLANRTKDRDLMTIGAFGRVNGWGRLTERGVTDYHTNEVDSLFVGYRACKRYFRRIKSPFTKNMFCAERSHGGVGACLGDSGGPYLIKDDTDRWYLTGIVIRGHACSPAGQYGVYTRYAKYHVWIQSKMNE